MSDTGAHEAGEAERAAASGASSPAAGRSARILELSSAPSTRREWFAELWASRGVLDILARKDFQTRYKRASLGVLWAVAVPLLQAAIMAFVFSEVIRVGNGKTFAVYVMGGVVAYAYFSAVVQAGSTAIVDGAGLTDKVWFPRALLVFVPALSNLVGFAVTLIALIVVMPVFGVGLGPHVLLLVPAALLLIALSVGFALVLSALDVYYRDVKFLVMAALMVLIYLAPIVYPQNQLGGVGPWLDINPLTGVVTLFHLATVGGSGPWARAVGVSAGATLLLLLVGTEAQRRHDRLFVDLL